MSEVNRTSAVSGPSLYHFTFPGCPAPVDVESTVIERLEALLRRAAGPSQGLLSGSLTPAGTEVRDYRPIAAFDTKAIADGLDGARGVVGYYRIRPAETMELTGEELAIAEAHFSGPGSVVLLMNQDRAEANFFFSEGGKYLNMPLLSFPLDAARLQSRTKPIVPLGMPAPSRGLAITEEPAKESQQPDVQERPRPRRKGGLWMLFAGALIATAAGAGFFLYTQGRPSAAPLAPPAADPSSSAVASVPALPLRAERQGQDVKLEWDPRSPGIENAISGIIEITDGTAKRRIELGTAQMRYGSMVYSPVSDQVSITVTALQADGTAQEASVVVILSQAPGERLKLISVRRPVKPTKPFVEPQPAAPSDSPAVPAADELPTARIPSQTAASVPLPPVVAPRGTAQSSQAPTDREEATVVPPVLTYQAGVRTPPELRGFEKRPVNVSLRLLVDERGRVASATAVPRQQVHAAYIAAAQEAAQRCRFRPARRGNAAVRGEITMTFQFLPEN